MLLVIAPFCTIYKTILQISRNSERVPAVLSFPTAIAIFMIKERDKGLVAAYQQLLVVMEWSSHRHYIALWGFLYASLISIFSVL